MSAAGICFRVSSSRVYSSISCSISSSSPAAGAELWSSKRSYSVKLETLNRCKLGVAWYPDFNYNASGGGGIAAGVRVVEQGKLAVDFDPGSVFIPPVSYSTTKFLGLPLPPPLRIDIKPRVLQGEICQQTGDVELRFLAEFLFTAGSLYKAPALVVDTTLTTGSTKGKQRSGQGLKRDDESGGCNLVGTAVLSRVDDWFLNAFLGLPSECLAEMSARIIINEY